MPPVSTARNCRPPHSCPHKCEPQEFPACWPTMERPLRVRRLKKVDLPTFGRPTMATSGSAAAPGSGGTTDLRYFAKTCLLSPAAPKARRPLLIPNPLYAIQVEHPVAADQ